MKSNLTAIALAVFLSTLAHAENKVKLSTTTLKEITLTADQFGKLAPQDQLNYFVAMNLLSARLELLQSNVIPYENPLSTSTVSGNGSETSHLNLTSRISNYLKFFVATVEAGWDRVVTWVGLKVAPRLEEAALKVAASAARAGETAGAEGAFRNAAEAYTGFLRANYAKKILLERELNTADAVRRSAIHEELDAINLSAHQLSDAKAKASANLERLNSASSAAINKQVAADEAAIKAAAEKNPEKVAASIAKAEQKEAQAVAKADDRAAKKAAKEEAKNTAKNSVLSDQEKAMTREFKNLNNDFALKKISADEFIRKYMTLTEGMTNEQLAKLLSNSLQNAGVSQTRKILNVLSGTTISVAALSTAAYQLAAYRTLNGDSAAREIENEIAQSTADAVEKKNQGECLFGGYPSKSYPPKAGSPIVCRFPAEARVANDPNSFRCPSHGLMIIPENEKHLIVPLAPLKTISARCAEAMIKFLDTRSNKTGNIQGWFKNIEGSRMSYKVSNKTLEQYCKSADPEQKDACEATASIAARVAELTGAEQKKSNVDTGTPTPPESAAGAAIK